VTDEDFTSSQPAMVVRSIKWDSGFRGTGLALGDRIIAVAGAPLVVPTDPAKRSRALSRMIGQLNEQDEWREAGRKDGDPLTLTVRRRRPPTGWETIDITGKLRAERFWRNADNRPIIGPGGPDQMEHDGFASTWMAWYENASTAWQRSGAMILSGSLVQLLDIDVDETSARIPKLAELYPGPFAAAVSADWAALKARVDGRRYTLKPGALDFRELGDKRTDEVRAAGTAARAAFLAAHAAELIPPFPSIDPILGDRSAVAGKLVELPRITQREWINQGNGSVLVFAQGNDCYVAEVVGSAERMIVTQRRYETLLRPNLPSQFDVVARIRPDPTAVVLGETAYFALKVDPVAATVADAFFVDLSTGADPAPFTGEELLRREVVAPPGAEAAPQDIIAAMIGALKVGDLELWTSLFATWTFFIRDDGPPIISPWGPADLEANWALGRQRILDDVIDVRLVWIDDPVTVFRGDAFEGAPTIEQTVVEVDHLRLEADGSARAFQRVQLTRLWTLQRLNGSPWRIATNAGI
jgi:hypothetical protein